MTGVLAASHARNLRPFMPAVRDPGSGARIRDVVTDRLQFDAGEGPVAETVRYNEPRRIDEMANERRWPAFCQAAAQVGFSSCLALPLRTYCQPGGAIALYSEHERVFQGAALDTALLFAAQGGTAVHNASVYRTCRRMIDNLHAALESRAVIEQGKGILHAELGIPPEEAFQLLKRASQDTNKKVRDLSADLVQGKVRAEWFAQAPGRRPVRHASRRPPEPFAAAVDGVHSPGS